MKIPKVNLKNSKFGSGHVDPSTALNESSFSENKTIFEKIKSAILSHQSMSPSPGLEIRIPAKHLQNVESNNCRVENNKALNLNKVLSYIDIELIRNFEPRSWTDAMEAVRLARHALLNENIDETSYFLPDEVSEMLEKARKVVPENPDINFWLGLCARRQVRFPREKEMAKRSEYYLGKVYQIYPQHRDVKSHYAASLWMTAREHWDQEQSPLIKTICEQLLQEDDSDLLLHILAALCDSPFKLMTCESLNHIEKLAADNVFDIPIQSFLLSCYYGCFSLDITIIRYKIKITDTLRNEIKKTHTFDSIHKKTLSCIEHLKSIDSSSTIVWQTEHRLEINGKKHLPITRSGPQYMPRAEGFFYDTLWRQDARLNFVPLFNQTRLQTQKKSKKIYVPKTLALPRIEEQIQLESETK